MLAGVIEEFDERRGYGFLVAGGGGRFFFHCVDIADGSRSIRNGFTATGERSVGRLGRDEAINVRARD